MLVLGLVAVAMMKEVPLRTRSGVEARYDAEHDGRPAAAPAPAAARADLP